MPPWHAVVIAALVQPWPLVAATAAIVVEAKLSSEETYISLFLFCLIATSSVLVMEIHAVFRPERSRALLARVKAWIDTYTDQAIIIVSVLLGLWLIGKGSYLLATRAHKSLARPAYRLWARTHAVPPTHQLPTTPRSALTQAPCLPAAGAPQEDPRAGLCFPSLFTICPVLRTAGWPVSVTALYGLRHPRDLGLRVLPGRRVPSSSRSSSTGGRPARSIFLRTWPSSLAMKTPPTPVKPVWS